MTDTTNFADLASTAYRRFLERLARLPELEREREAAQRDAETDSLTGLFNRRGIERRRTARSWYVACDLDGFKAAQDADPRGHAYGDDVLAEFAHYLREQTRGTDSVVGRVGGDEFLVRVDTKAGARRVRDLVRRWRSHDQKVSASAGMGADPEWADCSCYLDKADRRAGRDTVLHDVEVAWADVKRNLTRRIW